MHGGVNLPLNSGGLLHGWQNLARDSVGTFPRWKFYAGISGRLLHGWQNLARDSVQTFAGWGMASPRFSLYFCRVGDGMLNGGDG